MADNTSTTAEAVTLFVTREESAVSQILLFFLFAAAAGVVAKLGSMVAKRFLDKKIEGKAKYETPVEPKPRFPLAPGLMKSTGWFETTFTTATSPASPAAVGGVYSATYSFPTPTDPGKSPLCGTTSQSCEQHVTVIEPHRDEPGSSSKS